MGYRSQGKLYLSEKAQELLPAELKEGLDTDWTAEDYNIWSFDEWKWYSNFSDIKVWEDFINELNASTQDETSSITENDWDICIVGEDGAVYEDIPCTCTKFGRSTIIVTY